MIWILGVDRLLRRIVVGAPPTISVEVGKFPVAGFVLPQGQECLLKQNLIPALPRSLQP